MSCNSYGKLIVGSRILKDDIKEAIDKYITDNTIIEKGCEHNIANVYKFCPECGKQTKIETKPTRPDEYEFLSNIVEKNKLYMVHSTDQKDFFITTSVTYFRSTGDINGYGSCESLLLDEINTTRIEKMKEELKSKLKNLWREEQFRIWLVPYCSY